jgi:hypothetical protein
MRKDGSTLHGLTILMTEELKRQIEIRGLTEETPFLKKTDVDLLSWKRANFLILVIKNGLHVLLVGV